MKRHRRALLLACCAFALALLWWRAQATPRATVVVTPAPIDPSAPPATRAARARPSAPLSEPSESADAPEDCLPGALEQCVKGDVWSLDSCGTPEEKLEECEARACRDGACDAPPSEPCDEPPDGRCAGDTVRLCELGTLRIIDCGRRGLRCGYGDEGAECKPEIPIALRCHGAARCDGDVLVRCDDGQLVRSDCRALRAKCLKLADAPSPACVEVRSAVVPGQDCGPCGCPANVSPETCDGRDEDADGQIDEEVACAPVPVIAFVITDASGGRSHADEDIAAELAAASQFFARTEVEGAPSFTLQEIVPIAAPALLELDQRALDRLAIDPLVHPPRDAFYVPLIFTDRIVTGGTPKSGIATLPNGTCGGVQEGQGPDVGLVAVAKGRYPTTVAHELGHFLGLCHTHDQQQSATVVAFGDPGTGAIERCRPSCKGQGDGVCDTPSDPGPELCDYDAQCRTACRTNAAPDPSNLMSYYSNCRDRFSAEQLRLVQHTIALRRGWHRCAGGACACRLGDDVCPVAMTCRPMILQTGEEATRCALDGPRPPGADCDANDDCGGGAICMVARERRVTRCVRACREPSATCSCTDAGEGLSVCIEDLGGPERTR